MGLQVGQCEMVASIIIIIGVLFYPEHKGSRFFRNVGTFLQNHMASHPKT